MKQYSAEIEIDGKKTKIKVFPNSYKTEDKHPDYIVYINGEKSGAIWESEKEDKPKESSKPKEDSKLEPF